MIPGLESAGWSQTASIGNDVFNNNANRQAQVYQQLNAMASQMVQQALQRRAQEIEMANMAQQGAIANANRIAGLKQSENELAASQNNSNANRQLGYDTLAKEYAQLAQQQGLGQQGLGLDVARMQQQGQQFQQGQGLDFAKMQQQGQQFQQGQNLDIMQLMQRDKQFQQGQDLDQQRLMLQEFLGQQGIDLDRLKLLQSQDFHQDDMMNKQRDLDLEEQRNNRQQRPALLEAAARSDNPSAYLEMIGRPEDARLTGIIQALQQVQGQVGEKGAKGAIPMATLHPLLQSLNQFNEPSLQGLQQNIQNSARLSDPTIMSTIKNFFLGGGNRRFEIPTNQVNNNLQQLIQQYSSQLNGL